MRLLHATRMWRESLRHACHHLDLVSPIHSGGYRPATVLSVRVWHALPRGRGGSRAGGGLGAAVAMGRVGRHALGGRMAGDDLDAIRRGRCS